MMRRRLAYGATRPRTWSLPGGEVQPLEPARREVIRQRPLRYRGDLMSARRRCGRGAAGSARRARDRVAGRGHSRAQASARAGARERGMNDGRCAHVCICRWFWAARPGASQASHHGVLRDRREVGEQGAEAMHGPPLVVALAPGLLPGGFRGPGRRRWRPARPRSAPTRAGPAPAARPAACARPRLRPLKRHGGPRSAVRWHFQDKICKLSAYSLVERHFECLGESQRGHFVRSRELWFLQ